MSFEEELKAQKERLLKEKNDKEMEDLNKKLEEQYRKELILNCEILECLGLQKFQSKILV